MKVINKRMSIVILALIAVVVAGGLTIDNYVRHIGLEYIVNEDKTPKADAILVLGAFCLS